LFDKQPDVLDIADANERALELALLKAFKDTQAQANISAFQKAYASGDFAGALAALHLENLVDSLTNG
jgi:hypothetical protein